MVSGGGQWDLTTSWEPGPGLGLGDLPAERGLRPCKAGGWNKSRGASGPGDF